MTATAALVPDVSLLRIDDPDHCTTASWALIPIDGIAPFAGFFITNIDCCCRLPVSQNIDFAGVEPDAIADGATIDLGAFIVDLFHVRSALRAAHGTRPEDADLVTADAVRVSRAFSFLAC